MPVRWSKYAKSNEDANGSFPADPNDWSYDLMTDWMAATSFFTDSKP